MFTHYIYKTPKIPLSLLTEDVTEDSSTKDISR